MTVTTTGDSATTGDGAARDGRTRIERYDPAAIEPRWQARWAELGLYDTDLDDTLAAALLPADDVPVPVGRPAHRPLVHQDAHRRDRPLPADARRQRVLPDRVRRLRAAGRERRDQEQASTRASGRWRNIENMRRQLRTMGATFDWDAEVVTCDPEYYRWNQWLFLQFLEAGLAYARVSPVDWCPNDGTLAREQVEGTDRRCWRCGAKVEKRDLEQWYLRITNYADELLDFTRHRLAGAGPDHADELDRPLEGAEIVFATAPSAAPRRRRGAAGLHDAAGHAVRRDVHGPGAGAPAGRRR